jgi:DNA-binding HxlR family transcriptional regulator
MAPDEGKAGRSYRQYCGVARGLDVVGERWTLLLVRDLLLGPKRYKDLLDGLPGIGTNLLAARLRELEKVGLLRRTVLPPPAGSTVYELTEAGQALEPVVAALGRWGVRFMDRPHDGDFLSPTAFAFAMRATFRPEAATGVHETWELRVGGRVFEVRVEDGRCTTTEGPPRAPATLLETDEETLRAIRRRGLTADEALRAGRVAIRGDPSALERFVQIFGGQGELQAAAPPV